MLVAILYLFVGLAHNAVCADQPIPFASVPGQVLAVADAGSDDCGSKSAAVLCDHCPTCLPGLTPGPVFVVTPSAQPADVTATADPLRVDDHSRLETPPPKTLT